ncbi:NosD domain-containing protein [Pontiella sulfatireligans]|uniref:PKD domain-containing protein n=1 Tax=Pontiella sulfatireligans TaxID=2750658 RepID=A0A6C2UF38_9BACT|nr:NosD domain-containing protein [Pontiella sulfatireligans]VGO18765.1 hypothetical protein SCARR_00818 [Pontiella sulfatireligans]
MKSSRLISFIFRATIALGATLGSVTQARNLFVDVNSSAASVFPYTDEASPAKNIQDAVDATIDGDLVWVSPGTYLPTSEILVTNAIQILSYYTYLGDTGVRTTIVDGQNERRCFNLSNSDCSISGLTIQNGSSNSGGGVYCSDNIPSITDCIFEGNTATYSLGGGGGLYKGTATGCTFTSNSAASGGGAKESKLFNCTLTENEASSGGGLYKGSATDCIIKNNEAQTGGAFYYVDATNCIVADNVAQVHGGGLFGGSAIGCAIFGNTALDQGGGSAYATLTQCTVTDNAADKGGGTSGGQLNNSIIWNNRANAYANVSSSQGFFSCYPEATPEYNGCITNNPQLVSSSHISFTSPCLGAGDGTYAIGTDIDGQTWKDAPTMGCDEVYANFVSGQIIPTLETPELVIVNETITINALVEGAVTETVLDFGDGTFLTNPICSSMSHSWSTGNYNVILTGYNDTHPEGIAVTNLVLARSDEYNTIYVSAQTGSDFSSGESWAEAKQTIQGGVDAQDAARGLVLVSNGTYSVTTEIIVDKEIRIQSLNGSDVTTIQGDRFYLNNQHCLVEGFTIRDASGGAIYCSGLNPIVSNCIITENSSGGSGGGVMWRGTANSCTFTNNTGRNGPGGMQDGIANDCLFINNVSANIGGGGMRGGIANRCIFKGNKAIYGGGARDTEANDCQFLFNETIPDYRGDTAPGGGMYSGTANNCVFRGNKSLESGGGAYGTIATHCTFTANLAATTGGGLYNGTANNCILWYNTALISDDNIAASTANYSCAPELTHGTDGNITNMPQLVSASHISAASPCVNGGSAAYSTSAADIDGDPWQTPPAMGCDQPAYPPVGAPTITIVGPTHVATYFTAFYTIDIQGAIERDLLDFGDGFTAINTAVIPISHTWTVPGTYNMVVTGWNDYNSASYSVTNVIEVSNQNDTAIHVAPNGDDDSVGTTWSTAKQTIQAGIDAQDQTGGLVLVSNGVYTLTETIQIDKEIRLSSVNGAATTIIDGGSINTYTGITCIEIADNHTTVSDFTVRNGYDSTSLNGYLGGGIFCDHSLSPQIHNCIFLNNQASQGAGMAYGTAIDCVFSNNISATGEGGGLYIGNADRCRFVGNIARNAGGGMYAGTANDCTFTENKNDSAGSVYGNGAGMSLGTANRCTFTHNDSNGYGGGMNEGTANDCVFFGNASVNGGGGMRKGTATDCTFVGNSTGKNGGGFDYTTATRCTLSGNHAALGGGTYSGSATACAISGNTADDIGGGTHSTTLFNCTVTGNSASEVGGVYRGSPKNCIIWGNTASFGMNDFDDGSSYYNYIYNTCSPDAPYGIHGCITNNPLLVSSSHIAANSPCIGKGDAAYATGTDLDGEAWNTLPAMGCDEIGAFLSGPIEMAFFGPSPIVINTVGNYTALFNGPVSKTIVDFTDGTRVTNAIGVLPHAWSGPNSASHDVILTAFNETYPQGASYTQAVEVVNCDDSDIHVHSSGDDLADGKSWATAKQTIQAGVDAQNIYGGRVLVDGNTYSISEAIEINKPIYLKGYDYDSADGAIPIIDGGGNNRCFMLGVHACILENFIIQNGEDSGNNGGGIYCENGAPRITYSTISNCIAYNGAGIYKGTVEHCTLENNTATSLGGAAYFTTVEDSTLIGNNAQYGGGLHSGTLTGCTLSNNTATTYGGGAYNCRVIVSTISSNTAPSGGGLYQSIADRCHISHNQATGYAGGGIYSGTAQNCTIAHNQAEQNGGGSFGTELRNCTVAENHADAGGGVRGGTIYNSIVWNNTATTEGNNLLYGTFKNSCSPDLLHGQNGNITNAPLFLSLSPNPLHRGSDYFLGNYSPCLNAGDNSTVETDLDFNDWERIRYGTVDMGAIEMDFYASDSDGDDMRDGWELEHFGGVTNAVADADADADVFDNYSEYIAGTDPNDGTSYLRVTQCDVEEDGANVWITLKWEPSVEGRAYAVQWSTNLVNGFQDRILYLPYPDDQITFGNDLPESFYKIKVWIED